MVGDLLVSANVPRSEAIDIPTRFNGFQPATSPQFTQLSQKIFAINRQFAVAWAGQKIVAKHLVRRIAAELPEPRDGSEILELISSSGLSQAELASVAFIFFRARVQGDQAHLFVQDYLTGETVLGEREKVKYAGSGRQHFLDSIGFRMADVSGDSNDFEKLVSALIGRMAIALYQEVVSDVTHKFWYGGGFELLYLSRQVEMVKLPLTLFFWGYDDDGVDLVGPILTLNYGPDGHLFIHRLHWSNHSNWSLATYVVGNLLNEAGQQPIAPSPDFQAPPFSVHYLINKHRRTSIQFLIKKFWQSSISIKYLEDRRSVSVICAPEFLQEIRRTTTGR